MSSVDTGSRSSPVATQETGADRATGNPDKNNPIPASNLLPSAEDFPSRAGRPRGASATEKARISTNSQEGET